MKKYTSISFIGLLALLICSCTESFEPENKGFESVLTVDGKFTDSLTFQKIRISTSFQLETLRPDNIITNAEVTVEDDSGNNFQFAYNPTDSTYTSINQVKAETGNSYRLRILLNDGSSYLSEFQELPPENTLAIQPELTTLNNEVGISIKSNSSNNGGYFRYDYVETYKIVAPFWAPIEAYIQGPMSIQVRGRSIDNQICYASKKSDEIIIKNTQNQNTAEDDFSVRFINQQNPKITTRYSILVNQYSVNFEAFNYYSKLEKIYNASTNNLSTVQPGFIQGNIFNEDREEKTLGFFEVSSVTSKRAFFNYEDFFPGALPPPYFENCNQLELDSTDFTRDPPGDAIRLTQQIENNTAVLYRANGVIFTMVPRACGDCTALGSTEVPEFWEE